MSAGVAPAGAPARKCLIKSLARDFETAGRPAPLEGLPRGRPGAWAWVALGVSLGVTALLTFAVASLPGAERIAGLARPLIVFGFGLTFSVLLFALLWSLSSTRDRALALAGRITETLGRSEERYRSVLDRMADGLLVVDLPSLEILDANPACGRFLGFEKGELLTRTVFDISGHDRESILANAGRAVREKALHVGERSFRKKDGFLATLDTSLVCLEFEGRNVLYCFLRDLTDQRELEAQLRQAQKMEAVGTLAGGVAHDFNNLLTAILGYAELLGRRRDLDDDAAKSVEEIRKAGERAAALTRQLLAFSRKQILQPTVLDLNDVVRDSERMFSRLLGENIRIETRLEEGLAPVRADATQLQQILLNLAVNARDAMPEGGTLAFATGSVTAPGPGIPVVPKVPPGPYVLLSVSDTGVGMTPEEQGRVFEPFFTTKERGKGTGLGLSTVYGIVKQSGGFIFVSSWKGRGTTFRILLPAAGRAIGPADSRVGPVRPVRGGSETVLVIEDEEGVRRLSRMVLGAHGYRVLEAGTGEEALRLTATYGGRIDLLVTDVVLPGMSGRKAAEEILRDRPSLKVLYISGYTGDKIAPDGVLESGLNFLEKPFTPENLARKVRRVLDGPGPAAGSEAQALAET